MTMAQIGALVAGCIEADAEDARRQITVLRMAESGTEDQIAAWLDPPSPADAQTDDDGAELAAALAAFGLQETT